MGNPESSGMRNHEKLCEIVENHFVKLLKIMRNREKSCELWKIIGNHYKSYKIMGNHEQSCEIVVNREKS